MKGERPVVLGMAVHPPELAATRLRLTQYFPYLEEAGFRCELWTFLRDRDLPAWYGKSHTARVRVLVRGVLRIPAALWRMRRARVIVIQRECLPFGPPVLEWLAARCAYFVWDVDDFVWRSYVSPTAGRWTRWLRTSSSKHTRTCRWADDVWAGSDAIEEWVLERRDGALQVPTVVRVPDQRPQRKHRAVAAWVGSHSTAPFLEDVLPSVAESRQLQLLEVVGGEIQDTANLAVHCRPWTETNETEVCVSASVGLYPVDVDNEYAEGKCGLKAILYMAYGLPPVVTPTRPNAAVVRDGIDGLHVQSPDQWAAQVDRLITDPDLWERCSKSGYERVASKYSLQVWGPILAQRVHKTLEPQPTPGSEA